MSITVMVTLLFLMPLFQYTPNVVLGAIIVTAVVGLIDIPEAYQIWKIDKFDFLVMLCAFFGVIFISVQGGLAIAVSSQLFIYLIVIRYSRSSPESKNLWECLGGNRLEYLFSRSSCKSLGQRQ